MRPFYSQYLLQFICFLAAIKSWVLINYGRSLEMGLWSITGACIVARFSTIFAPKFWTCFFNLLHQNAVDIQKWPLRGQSQFLALPYGYQEYQVTLKMMTSLVKLDTWGSQGVNSKNETCKMELHSPFFGEALSVTSFKPYHCFCCFATFENKTQAEMFPKFPSIVHVIEIPDRNLPITAC